MKLSRIFCIVVSVFLLFLTQNAFADELGNTAGCSTLNSNDEWIALYNLFLTAYSEEKYEEALTYGEEMQKICSISPVLNYMMGSAYMQFEKPDVALKFFRNATSHTDTMAVSAEELNQIWEARLDAEMLVATSTTRPIIRVVNDKGEQTLTSVDAYDAAQFEEWQKLFYAGAGVTGGGGLLLVIGAALAGYVLSEANVPCKDEENSFACGNTSGNTIYSKGYSVLSAGITMAALGGGLALGGAGMLTWGKLKMKNLESRYLANSANKANEGDGAGEPEKMSDDRKTTAGLSMNLQFAPNGMLLSGTF